jgi:hypothetical protein
MGKGNAMCAVDVVCVCMRHMMRSVVGLSVLAKVSPSVARVS